MVLLLAGFLPNCVALSQQLRLALSLPDNSAVQTRLCPTLPNCAEHGASGPATQALQHARSHEPAVPAIWEAMADVAALSQTGERRWVQWEGYRLPTSRLEGA